MPILVRIVQAKLWNNMKRHVASQRPARCGHGDIASRCARWNSRFDEGVGNDSVRNGCSVKRDRSCAGESLPKDLRRLADLARREDEPHERRKSHVQSENDPPIIDATDKGRTVKFSIRSLEESPLGQVAI